MAGLDVASAAWRRDGDRLCFADGPDGERRWLLLDRFRHDECPVVAALWRRTPACCWTTACTPTART
ncbi:hypothetical protein [Saccharothrix yanglingensis]|uniref:Uncharacterized protein n=1 Tax=Saccharothrix yanglingensis TaxID=659496 RepID=A0ABU0WVC3_9PSEU|nr:hypothetical protein [Saccharothrix yanglingensis]MDQ2583808.1 hypothetical protein [Saccharothrix yanglingensis]